MLKEEKGRTLKLLHSCSDSLTDLIADQVQMGHGGGLIPFAAVQTGGQGELTVGSPRFYTATSALQRLEMMGQNFVGLL